MNLTEILKGAEDTAKKIEQHTGVYKDPVTDDTDTMSKLPYSSLPQGQDPSPFTIGPAKK